MVIRFSFIIFILFGFTFNVFAQSNLMINEFMASNLNWIADEDDDFEDWIEIYNSTANSIDVAGYYLSDDFSELNKWQIPSGFPEQTTISSGGFLLFWADDQPWEGLTHVGFKLSASGEHIALIDKDGFTIIDTITFQIQNTNISQGRYPNGGAEWFLFDQPTPSESNPEGYPGITAMPDFWQSAGFYSGGISVTLKNNDPQATLYYTLDGSNPDQQSATYNGQIIINGSSVLRTRGIKDDYIPSKINSNTYFIDETFNLPVLTLITDPKNLFDASTGIYTNYNKYGMDWERDVHTQYFRDDLEFSIPAGIRIQGSTSRFMAKKSFRLFFRDGYGQDRLEYDLFDNPLVSTFKNIVMRAGYDDDITMPEGTLLRDPFVSELWQEIGQLSSLSNFAILQINNDYWGIYNLRESINEFFIQDHLDYDSFDLMRFEKSRVDVKYGSRDEWDGFWNFIETADFTLESDYEEAKKRINIDNFLAVQGFVQCAEYRSYLWGCLTYRESRPGAPWNFIIWDMDRAFTNVDWNGIAAYNLTNNENWANLMMKKLLLNPEFKQLFINRVADYLNTYFTTDHAISKLDSLVNIVSVEMPNEVDRWNSTISKWENNVEQLRDFARQRPDILRDQILSQYGIADTIHLSLMADANQGKVQINSITVNQFPWQGVYFKDVPIKVTALPKAGYKFTGWIPSTYPSGQATLLINPENSIELEALFEPDRSSAVIINEINYNSGTELDPGDWIELFNKKPYALDLSGCKLQDENQAGNIYILPSSSVIPAKGYLVLCENKIQFQSVFPDAQNCIGDFGGASGFGFSGSGELLQLKDPSDAILDDVLYDDAVPWPTSPDGEGTTLELIDPDLDNMLAESWRASIPFGGTPGAVNSINTALDKLSVELPTDFLLLQNYPNPFNPKTVISYHVGANHDLPVKVDLSIYNILGQKVATLVSEKQQAGIYTVKWDAEQSPSGIYYYRLTADQFMQTKRMILLK